MIVSVNMEISQQQMKIMSMMMQTMIKWNSKKYGRVSLPQSHKNSYRITGMQWSSRGRCRRCCTLPNSSSASWRIRMGQSMFSVSDASNPRVDLAISLTTRYHISLVTLGSLKWRRWLLGHFQWSPHHCTNLLWRTMTALWSSNQIKLTIWYWYWHGETYMWICLYVDMYICCTYDLMWIYMPDSGGIYTWWYIYLYIGIQIYLGI